MNFSFPRTATPLTATQRTRKNILRTTALLACLSLGSVSVTACGLNSQNSQSSSAKVQETSFDKALESVAHWTKEDPRTFTGLSNSATVGDVTPITDNAQPALPVTLTDTDGHKVTVSDVSRILPLDLYGTTSRTVAGLGLRKNIIGRSVSSQEPSLQHLPVVTQGGHNINVEAVLNLKPSVVIVDHSIGPASAIDQIREAGVTVVVLSPKHTHQSLAEDIKTIAGVLGVAKEGEQLAARALKEHERAVETVKKFAPEKPLRMAFVYARGTGGVFFILGPDSGTSDLINAVGGVDAAAEAGIGDMTPANAEALAKLNPEVIVMMTKGLESTGGLEGMLVKPGVKETVAGKNQRIVTIPDSQALSFGPQTGEMTVAFAEALYQKPKVR